MNNQNTEARLRAVFGFKTMPFTKDLDPERIFETTAGRKACKRLHYLARRRGIGVLIAAPGLGKSTLVSAFLASLSRAEYLGVYISHTTCAILDLYRQIAGALQLQPAYRKADLMRQIQQRLLKLSREQKIKPVMVIDEANMLPPRFLDELRILCSFDADSRDEITLVLAGLPQLEANLRLAVNEPFSQRIIMRIRLRELSAEEVAPYLDFRLKHAGRTAKLFMPDAIQAIAKASRGVPRLIDRIAEHCLLIALERKAKEIDTQIVNLAQEEMES